MSQIVKDHNLLELSFRLANQAAAIGSASPKLSALYSQKALECAKRAFCPTADLQDAELQAAEESELNDLPE